LGSGFISALILGRLGSGSPLASSSLPWIGLLAWGGAGIALCATAGLGYALLSKMPQLARSEPAAKGGSQEKLLADTGAKLNLELGKVLALIRARIGSDETYAASLAAAQTRLAQLPTAEQVRVIVSLLVAENQRMRLDSTNMAKQLEGSRQQIENLRKRLEKAQEVGLLDPLTNIGNRRCFDLALADAVKAATASHATLAIVLGDLDSFKRINDDFGHPVGDEVLKFFAQLLVGSVREGDTVARFGGEEFALILPMCGGREASGIAERVRIKLGAKGLTVRSTAQEIGQVTASFGVAEMRAGESVDDFLRRADGGLYQAKKTGRNRVVLV
jgi:diguanylate cyclase